MRTIIKGREKLITGSALMQAVYFLGGALVSRGAVFGSYAPFGVSFAAAVPYQNALSAGLGSVLGYILLMKGGSFRCVASVVTVLALRWLFSELPKIANSRLFAPFAASCPLLCTGLVMTAATGKGKTEIVFCVLESLLAAAGAYFLHETSLLAAGRRGIATFDQQEVACIVMTCSIFMLSCGGIAFGGISLGRILASLAILLCAYCGGAAGGCIGGTAAGVVFGLSSGEAGFLPLSYSFGGLMAGIFSYVGRLGAAASFLLCSTAVSLAGGVTAASASQFYETVIASIIFIFMPRDIVERAAAFVSPRIKNDADGLRSGVIMRLDLASKALQSINDAVNSVSLRLGEYYSNELDGVFARSVEESCSRCGMRAFCERDGEENHRERLASLAPILKSTGEIDSSDVRRIVNKKCCRGSELAQAVNDNYAGYKSCLAAKERVAQVRGVVAGQFAGLSEILASLRDEFERYETCDKAAAERVAAALKVRGFFVSNCSVCTDSFGRMTVEVETAIENRRLLKRLDVTHEISRVCARNLLPPEISTAGDRLRVVFSEKPRLDVQIGTAQHICSNGRLCGDSFNYFNDGKGRFITVISDGMGTGGRAAVDGSMAVSVISRLVRSGLGFDASLGAANSALMVKSDDESLATADILCFDLFSGEAEIMKAGAPVTFLRKSGKVIRIEPPSLPAGIMADIKLTHDKEELDDGDIIVMVTDGAVSLSDEWIGAMVRDFEGADVQELVNDIIDEAMIGSKFGRDDDITVVGIRVMEN